MINYDRLLEKKEICRYLNITVIKGSICEYYTQELIQNCLLWSSEP